MQQIIWKLYNSFNITDHDLFRNDEETGERFLKLFSSFSYKYYKEL